MSARGLITKREEHGFRARVTPQGIPIQPSRANVCHHQHPLIIRHRMFRLINKTFLICSFLLSILGLFESIRHSVIYMVMGWGELSRRQTRRGMRRQGMLARPFAATRRILCTYHHPRTRCYRHLARCLATSLPPLVIRRDVVGCEAIGRGERERVGGRRGSRGEARRRTSRDAFRAGHFLLTCAKTYFHLFGNSALQLG